MSYEARVSVDVVFHNKGQNTFEVGYVSDHLSRLEGVCESITETVTADPEAVTATTASSLDTLAIKNSGSSDIVIGGVITVPAGRVAVLPTSTPVTVEAPSGIGEYTAIWVG